MNVSKKLMRQTLAVATVFILCAMVSVVSFAQQSRGTLRGVIKDELGATIVGATVTLTDAAGAEKTATTNGEGAYVFNGVAPGKYFLRASAAGFAASDETEVEVTAGDRHTRSGLPPTGVPAFHLSGSYHLEGNASHIAPRKESS